MQFHEHADWVERVMAEVIDSETGEITDEGLAKLEAVEVERDEKALAIALYHIGILAEAEMVKQRAAELAARAKVLTNQAGRLKQTLTDWLTVGTKLRDDKVQIGWRKSTAVDVADPDALPADCWKPQDPKIDLKGIGERIKDGEEIPGARLVTRHSVQIR